MNGVVGPLSEYIKDSYPKIKWERFSGIPCIIPILQDVNKDIIPISQGVDKNNIPILQGLDKEKG